MVENGLSCETWKLGCAGRHVGSLRHDWWFCPPQMDAQSADPSCMTPRSWEESQTLCPGCFWEAGSQWLSAKWWLRQEEEVRAIWVISQIFLQWVTWVWTERTATSPPLGGENRWFKVVGGHEWDHSCRGAGEIVMRILYTREKRGPEGGMMGCDAAEGGLQVLAISFCLSIWLRVITRDETGGRAKRIPKSLPNVTYELGVHN